MKEVSLQASIGMMYFFGLIYAVAIGLALQWKIYPLAGSLAFWGFILSIGTLIKAIRRQ